MSERTCTPLSDNVEDPGKYCPGGLHPIHINDTLSNNRYLILHKLNRGSFSTVWLARDTLTSSYVALKINTASISLNTNESNILAHLASRPSTHPGREFVMTVKDEFVIDGPNGKNQVFVTDVAGGQLRRTEGVGCMDLKTPRVLARQLFMAVQYLHECGIVHGGWSLLSHFPSHACRADISRPLPMQHSNPTIQFRPLDNRRTIRLHWHTHHHPPQPIPLTPLLYPQSTQTPLPRPKLQSQRAAVTTRPTKSPNRRFRPRIPYLLSTPHNRHTTSVCRSRVRLPLSNSSTAHSGSRCLGARLLYFRDMLGLHAVQIPVQFED